MSKHDFTNEEFAGRLSRTRAAIGAGRARLAARDPSGFDALADRAGQQELHGVPVPSGLGEAAASSTIFTRDMERNEFEADSMADEVRSYNGREPEDPMEAFAKFADELGLKSARVGHGGSRLLSPSASLFEAEGHSGPGAGRRAERADQQPEAREIAAGARIPPPLRADRRRAPGRRCCRSRARARASSSCPARPTRRSCRRGASCRRAR